MKPERTFMNTGSRSVARVMPQRAAQVRPRQRGAAAVPVVMVLFFIMGIVFFYANRGLIFEQRSSANQYRYTQAFETAEAGLEWALTMLNSDRFIDAACAPITGAPTASSTKFRNRVLTFDGTTGVIGPSGLRAACVLNASGLPTCSCPTAGNPTLTAVGANFQVEFVAAPGGQAGSIQVISHGCTSTGVADKDARCLAGGAGSSDGYARVSVVYGLIPALGSAPAATITARGAVAMQGSGAGVGVYNGDPSTNGITIDSGSTVDTSKARLATVPGSSPQSSVIQNDTSLQIAPEVLFASYFNMTQEEFKKTATVLPCSSCDSSDLETAYATGARVLWVEGDLAATANLALGGLTAPDSPVVVIVTGSATFSGTAEMVGLLYVMGDWVQQGGGSGFIRGAGVTQGAMSVTNGTPDFYYEANALRQLALSEGRFGRIAGSWKDF
jgi:hypothetical protein